MRIGLFKVKLFKSSSHSYVLHKHTFKKCISLVVYLFQKNKKLRLFILHKLYKFSHAYSLPKYKLKWSIGSYLATHTYNRRKFGFCAAFCVVFALPFASFLRIKWLLCSKNGYAQYKKFPVVG